MAVDLIKSVLANEETFQVQEGEEPKPWHRQPKETKKQYEGFKIWLRTPGYNVRTASETYRQIHAPHAKPAPPGRTPRYFRRWKAEQNWDGRFKALEQHLDQLRDQATVQLEIEQGVLWKQREIDWRAERYDLAEAIVKRVREMLQMPLYEVEKEWYEEKPDGKTIVHHVIMRPVKWRHADIASFLAIADKMAALSLGKPTDHKKVESDVNYHELSDEELDRRLKAKAKEIAIEFPELAKSNDIESLLN